LASERIQLPEDFFDAYLREGRAVILLDGLDEVADPKSRQRVARLVESSAIQSITKIQQIESVSALNSTENIKAVEIS
jgi:predicted NACHT family NTPase